MELHTRKDLNAWADLETLERERLIDRGDAMYRGERIDRNENGYPSVWVDNTYRLIHRDVAKRYLSPRIAACHVHHIDRDKTNFHPDNLAIATAEGHAAIHDQLTQGDERLRHALLRRTHAAERRSANAYDNGVRAGIKRCNEHWRAQIARLNTRRYAQRKPMLKVS